jgi:hypothetical protein
MIGKALTRIVLTLNADTTSARDTAAPGDCNSVPAETAALTAEPRFPSTRQRENMLRGANVVSQLGGWKGGSCKV